MIRRDPAIVVIGATGYTGALIARELGGGSPAVLAARDPDRLARVAAEAGIALTQTVDVTDPASLDRLIRPGDVVINTAGPFTELGEPVVRACVSAGAHYLDTTGEQPFMHAIHEAYHDAALGADVAVVNAMAFEYALGDCAVAIGADELGGPLRSVDVVYAWGGAASSTGTRRTVLRMLGRKAWVRRDGRLEEQSPGAGRRTVTLASGRTLHAVAFGAGEVVTAPRYLKVDRVHGWMVMNTLAARLVPMIAPVMPAVVTALRPLLEPLVTRQPDPTPEERAASAFTIRVELEAADGRRLALELQGTDPYDLTARAAIRGARRAVETDAPAGVLAPSQLVPPRSFLEELGDRGLRIVRDPAVA